MTTHLQMVSRILKDKGTSEFTLQKISSTGLLDPLHPSKGATTVSTPHSIRSFRGTFTNFQMKSGLVQGDDILLYIDPTDLEVEITTDDQVTNSAGDVYHLVGSNVDGHKGVQTFMVNDEIVLYIVQLRK